MDEDRELDILTSGLRALPILADHGPLRLGDFARLNRIAPELAGKLMHAFENCGYARRVPHGDLYVLTPLALGLVAHDNPAGAAVALAVDIVAELGCTLACPVGLSIRRGAAMMLCLTSQPVPAGDVPGTVFGLLDDITGIVQTAGEHADARDAQAARIRRDGYGIAKDANGREAVAVPVVVDGQVVAVLVVRCLPQGASVPTVRQALVRAARQVGRLLDRPDADQEARLDAMRSMLMPNAGRLRLN